MGERIKIVQIAYQAEWALAKFFDAVFNPEIQDKFDLIAICGIEKTKSDALESICHAINSRVNMLFNGWREGQRKIEIESLTSLVSRLSGDLKYFQVNGNQTLPKDVYSNADCIVIHSTNTTHFGYIEDAINHKKYVLCEKPLVPVINERGKPYREELNDLEKLIRNNNLVLMDAEHYSYKKASLIFYEKLDEFLESMNKYNGNVKIERIEGCVKEIDNPDFWRTKEILSLENKTGLMGDTMMHLLAFVSALGGRANPISVEYAIYPGYFVDTHASVKYEIEVCDSKYFTDNAVAEFEVSKFIDKRRENPENSESKYIRFYFNNGFSITADFRSGKVYKNCGAEEREIVFGYEINSNEYVNILNSFHTSIINREGSRTEFCNSVRTLDSIYRTYEKFPLKKNLVSLYGGLNE